MNEILKKSEKNVTVNLLSMIDANTYDECSLNEIIIQLGVGIVSIYVKTCPGT